MEVRNRPNRASGSTPATGYTEPMFTLGVLSRVLILTAAAAPIAAGQGTQPWDQILRLAPGSEVRVVAGNSKPINGTLDGVTADALQLNSGGSQQSIQRGEILSIAVKKGGHRLRNGMIGLAVGAGAGLGVGLATTQNGSNGWGTLERRRPGGSHSRRRVRRFRDRSAVAQRGLAYGVQALGRQRRVPLPDRPNARRPGCYCIDLGAVQSCETRFRHVIRSIWLYSRRC